MHKEMLTPENTTIILIDYAVGFADVLRSHDLTAHLNSVVALAKVGVEWNPGLVITSGVKTKPTGPLYPQVAEVIGDRRSSSGLRITTLSSTRTSVAPSRPPGDGNSPSREYRPRVASSNPYSAPFAKTMKSM
jgi:hypothetical protein